MRDSRSKHNSLPEPHTPALSLHAQKYALFYSLSSGGGQGGGGLGEQGARGVRETREERAGSGISMMTGSGREIPKCKLSLIVTAHHPVKETNPTTFLDFHLTFSEALNQNFNARKVKKRKFALGIEKRALLPVKLEKLPSSPSDPI